MSSTPDYAALVRDNRVKAYGIPWSDEELHAINELGMNPDDVREGFLTPEELEASKEMSTDEKTGEPAIRLSQMNKSQLIQIAVNLGISFDPAGVTRKDLIEAIREKKAATLAAPEAPQQTGQTEAPVVTNEETQPVTTEATNQEGQSSAPADQTPAK